MNIALKAKLKAKLKTGLKTRVKVGKIRKSIVRTVVNDTPTHLINAGYNTYSRIYKGQLSLGLPVAPELLVSQEQLVINAIGKLALTLYHTISKITGDVIPREEIKTVLKKEVVQGHISLTENVILLSENKLKHIILNRLNIDQQFFQDIKKEALKRHILTQSLKNSRQPAYFESEVDEKENNGRGDYETVYYQDFTREGKEIKFRRLVSMEAVTAGDNKPCVILVPGFANNSECFNISNQYSIAKNLADKGKWVYLFDPRGMGVNNGRHDPYYTVDTLIDYDLPCVLDFIFQRSNCKPSILMGHSMGGIVSENMVLNWGLRTGFEKIKLSDKKSKLLDSILVSKDIAKESLSKVRGIISLGSPKYFDKKSHLFFPFALWLNHFSRIFKLSEVPVRQVSGLMTQLPVLKAITRFIYNNNIGDLNFLISPENHKNDKYFIERYFKTATESIPLGLGFQFLKAVYDGSGFKRMDKTSLNYSNLCSFFPDNIPLFHFWGAKDSLASLKNMRYSKFYPHKIKKVYHLETVQDLKKVKIMPEPGQVIDFVIEGANHLDLLYGEKAKNIVHPVIEKITNTVWSDWSYNEGPNIKKPGIKDPDNRDAYTKDTNTNGINNKGTQKQC
jgi:pimeloyl-ACP methyl ester carboxylesterase